MHEYVTGYMQYVDGSWRAGRPAAKLAKIDSSVIWNRVDHSVADAMIKFEAISKELPKKARGIQFSVNDATGYEEPVEYAAYAYALKELSHQRRVISTTSGKSITIRMVYAGGMNHDELAEVIESWDSKRGHHTVLYDEMDGANWDSTMQQGTVEAEIRVYEYLGMRAAKGCRVAAGTVEAKMTCPHNVKNKRRIRYWTRWKRMSGKWNTTVGNVTVAMEIRHFTLTHLPPHLTPVEVECLFLGDDFLAAYWFDHDVDPDELAAAINALDRSCGITPERGIFASVLDVTFISLGVWRTRTGGIALVPHPGRQLNKLFWTIQDISCSPTRREEIGSCIAEAFWPIYKGCTMMERFLSAHYTKPGCRDKFEWYTKINFTSRVKDVDWASGMVYKYGIPLTACPIDLPKLGPNAIVCSHPVVSHMLAVESLDPADRPRCVGRA